MMFWKSIRILSMFGAIISFCTLLTNLIFGINFDIILFLNMILFGIITWKVKK